MTALVTGHRVRGSYTQLPGEETTPLHFILRLVVISPLPNSRAKLHVTACGQCPVQPGPGGPQRLFRIQAGLQPSSGVLLPPPPPLASAEIPGCDFPVASMGRGLGQGCPGWGSPLWRSDTQPLDLDLCWQRCSGGKIVTTVASALA